MTLKDGTRGVNFFQVYLLNDVHTVCPGTTKFGVVTHMGRGLVFRGQLCLHPKAVGPQRSPLLGVPFYLCEHHL